MREVIPHTPLVSVTVIAYRSTDTIIETLDSIYNQSYLNIELIISDDCSPDNTVEICREWIETHKDRFVRTELLTVEKNTGVSANCNRAVDACQGEWILELAGDDILMNNAVRDYISFVNEHIDAVYVFGRMEGFGRSKEEVAEYMSRCFNYSFFAWSREEQLRYLTFKGNCLPAAANFMNRIRLLELGIKNDERIPMLEDYPKWINLVRAGVGLHFMDKTIVKYRLSDNSLSTTSKPNPMAVKSNALLMVYYLCPLMWHFGRKCLAIHKYINAAPDAFGGLFWKVLYGLDRCFTNMVIKLGIVKSGEARKML